MLTSFCFVALIGITSFVKQNPHQNKDLYAANEILGYWDFGTNGILTSKEQYDVLQQFDISSAQGLVNFLKTPSEMFSETDYKPFFEGKTINLTADIDCSNIGWHKTSWNMAFSGIFQGNGCTITGVGKKESYILNGDGGYYGSLFYRVEGTTWQDQYGNQYQTSIRNLVLKDFQDSSGYDSGALCQWISGSVEIIGVSVVNYTVLNMYSFGNNSFGGLIGSVNNCNITIQDCEMENLIMCRFDNSQAYYAGVIGVISGNAANVNISRCVVKNFQVHKIKNGFGGVPSTSPDDFQTWLKENVSGGVVECLGSGNYQYYANKINNGNLILENTCHQPQTSIENLSDWGSYISTFDLDSTWFFDPAYNDGYPIISSRVSSYKKYKIYYTQTYANIEQLGLHGYVQTYIGETATNEANNSDHIYLCLPAGLGVSVDSNASDALTSGAEKKFKAIGHEGYKFKEWQLSTEPDRYGFYNHTAIFEPIILELKFEKAKVYTDPVKNDDTIYTTPEGTYDVAYNTELVISKNVYRSFSCRFDAVTYNCNIDSGWRIEEVTLQSTDIKTESTTNTKISGTQTIKLTGNTIITITLVRITYDIKFEPEPGDYGGWKNVTPTPGGDSSGGGNSSYEINSGELLKYTISEETATIEWSIFKREFNVIDGWKIEYVVIDEDNEITDSDKYMPETNGPKTIYSDVLIRVYTIKLYDITFADAIDAEENQNLENSSFNAPTNPLTIRSGESIEAGEPIKQEDGSSKIEYKYNDVVVATYTIPKFYTILTEADKDEIKNVNDSSDLTIQPQATFFACVVTMTKTDDENVATMSISGDDYGTANDGIFAVEFGTRVTFSISQSGGIFTYAYTFSSGQEITYTMAESKYAMRYILNETTGDRESICNGLTGVVDGESFTFETGTTSKNISPIFGLKQYAGELA